MRSADRGLRRGLPAATFAWLTSVALPSLMLGAEPSPSQGAAGDPRSAGEGPGLVGDPAWAIAIVIAIAVLTLLASLVYVRLTADRRSEPPA